LFCPKCGKSATTDAQFCAACGAQLPVNQQVQTPRVATPETAMPSQTFTPMPPPASNAGLGLGIAGLVFAVLTLAFGFYDFASWSSGLYDYIAVEEIGLLAIMSLLGIIFGAVSAAKKSAVGSCALSLSIFGFLLTMFLSQYSA
jgi:uncharacterized membrane protein